MDISSTSSATAATTQTESGTSSGSRKTSETSFKDEMQKAAQDSEKTEQETDNKTDAVENKTDEKPDNNTQTDNEQNENQKLAGEINMIAGQNQLNELKNNFDMQNSNMQILMNANAKLEGITRLTQTKVDYTGINMSMDDAKFFSDLVQNTDKTLQNVVNDLKNGSEQTVQKTTGHVKVSATLMNALNDAVKTNQPVRINLDKDVSVIIKVDKDGAVSATFIPGDKAVEEYLRQNISTLRQRFDDQELSYRDLTYSRQKQQNQEQNRKNNHKENDNE